MQKGMYFILLLCGLLSQGICSLSNENNEASSDINIRQKRVVGGVRHHRGTVPFLVTILTRGNYHAPASLLTADTAITSAHVFKNQDQSMMSLESRVGGGARAHHIVRLIFLDPQYNETHPIFKNLALVKFGPPIYFPASNNQPIPIYSGSLVEQHLEFDILNWGKPFVSSGGKLTVVHCRSISVQLISIQYCQQMYPGLIGPGNICANAVNAGQQAITDHDSGAPLIIQNKLLGILVFHGRGRRTDPDVFMNLMDPDIRRWIHEHVPALHLF